MVQYSNYISHQLPNHATRVRKLIRSIELTDPKLLAVIAKVETDDDLMSNFEAMVAYVLLCDPLANNTSSSKSDRHNVSELNDSSMIGGRTCQNLDLRFYDQKDFRTLNIEYEKKLRDWRESNPKEFGQSKKRVLNDRRDNKNKRQKKNNRNESSDMNAQSESVGTKLIN